MKRDIILRAKDIAEHIGKMAQRIVATHQHVNDLLLVGIRTGGEHLARRLQAAIQEICGVAPPVGVLDITLYRDDWTRIGAKPLVRKTEIPFPITDKDVILVDDVIFTGRTVRAAMDALIDFGRPRKIELAILVDRGSEYRELPITPNYVGAVHPTPPDQTIEVYLEEGGSRDHVAVEEKRAA